MITSKITSKITYRFQNGVTIDYTIRNDEKNPIAKCEWSCELTKKNIAPLMDEYVLKCIPFVYQQIADLTGQSILWVDKHGYYPIQKFEPKISVN